MTDNRASGGTVAYCAPGRRAVAETAINAAGTSVDEVAEHPWLDDDTVLIIKHEPIPLPAFDLAPRAPLRWPGRPMVLTPQPLAITGLA